MGINKLLQNSELTLLERNVLKYIVLNIDTVIKMGVRGIAKANYTSTSTIMRLSKKLGYTGFVDMHYHLLPLIRKNESGFEDSNNFLPKQQLDLLLKYITEKQINDFLDCLDEKSEKIKFIYATGFSAIAADYINKKLLVLGKRCILSSGTDSASVFENNLDYINTMFVISKSGETRQVLSKVKTAKENKIKVISFTGETDNSISRIADVSFKIQDSDRLDDGNTSPNMFFPNLLTLFEFLIYKDYKRLEDK
ncbi:MurR/RpiR family transcriptional regulator [Clostridium lacusfryxellense]|uniref:MurR/RpiR family transcriptional regulator n=1 Tax=Clostridium lacusfryxellense TaxID=205328 RepID=UPI001C0DE661|nr:MurR/RpiR family transcriptional regulator [Clostridium lacusfryxellense]MBU3110214.1 MurR/RpiR family transcriptional regulator [Clostridium lacusfryxellense]